MRSSNKTKFLLLLIIILAALLRLFALDRFPVSLYSDELASGYNAYSILKTGKDEFGEFLPVGLRSFGDWKTALPAYLAIPTIKLFGLNNYGLRLSAAVIGLLTVLVVYKLALLFTRDVRSTQKIALLVSYFLAVSPWHILHSRALLFEEFGLFFLILGIFFFYKYLNNSRFLIFSTIASILSIYAYHSLRIVTPLVIFFLLVRHRKDLFRHNYINLISLGVGVILLLPLLIQSIKNPEIIKGRASFVSIFYDQGVKLRLWELQTQDGISQDTKLTNFFHNKPYSYTLNILRRYLSHLDINFLYLQGDKASPFQISNMGFIYLVDLPLLIIGLYFIKRYLKEQWYFIIFWLLISIIPAALTFLTPSSNKIFNIIYPLIFIQVIGLIALLKKSHSFKPLVIFCTVFFYTVSFAYFLKQYFVVMPLKYTAWWHYGYKEVATLVKAKENQFKRIVVSDKLGVPYIYFLFYTKYDPAKYQSEANVDFHKDNLGFIHVNSFSKYEFIRYFDWNREKENKWPNTLYVLSADEAKDEKGGFEVKDPTGNVIIKLIESVKDTPVPVPT